MKQKILVIDDEESLVRLLRQCLEEQGYRVLSAGDGLQGFQMAQDEYPDLVVLDLMLPRMDGWETCRRIRDCSDVPIIMLTALGAHADRVRGLDLGADDYLTKPFHLSEFAARVRSALRRHRPPLTETMMLRIDDRLSLDQARRRLLVDGQRVELSPLEYRMLSYLVDNRDCVLTHQRLLTQVWGWEYMDETNYLKVYVHHLRKKIEPNPQKPRYILTERGMGYRFQVPR
jgi:two-component system KDP operon response regulator KdpE